MNLFVKNKNNRLSIIEYGCLLTLIGKARSEDFFTKCSCVGFNKEGRILGISYNGLCSKKKVEKWMHKEENRIKKNDFFIHAEQNFLSLIKRNECETLCLNISPCANCAREIAGYGIKKVFYLQEYHRCNKFNAIFDFYGVKYDKLSVKSKKKILNYINNKENFKELN